MKGIYRKLGQDEKKCFSLHFFFSIIDGIIRGILILNEFVFIKTLDGSDYQLAFLFQFSMVIFVFLIFINIFLKKIGNKKRLLRITAFITQIPLIFISFFPSHLPPQQMHLYHALFLAVFFVYYSGTLISYPTINLFLKNIYQPQNFSRLYSVSESAKKVSLLVSTFLLGIMLDFNEETFRIMYVLMAVLGIISFFSLAAIPYKETITDNDKIGFRLSVKQSINSMLDTVKKNKPYLYFEIGFMMYGLAFMMTVSVISLFLSNELALNYTSIAFYKNAYNILAIMLLPYTGKLLGKIDPRKFGMITFGSLGFYLLFLIITDYFPYGVMIGDFNIIYFLVIAITFNGVFAATMSLLWYIGSAYFCPPHQADIYQSSHLALTGIRSIFAPLFGIGLYTLWGYSITFAIGILFIAIGVLFLAYSTKRHKLIIKETT